MSRASVWLRILGDRAREVMPVVLIHVAFHAWMYFVSVAFVMAVVGAVFSSFHGPVVAVLAWLGVLVAIPAGWLSVRWLDRRLGKSLARVERRSPEECRDALVAWSNAHGWWPAYGRTLVGSGIPFCLGGEHQVVAAVEGTHRGRSALVQLHRVVGFTQQDDEKYRGFNFTITAVFTDADVPLTAAVPRRWVRALERMAGATLVEVESVEFNRRWRLVGTDAKAAHALMPPTVIARLLAADSRGRVVSWDAHAVMLVTPRMSDDTEPIVADLDLLVDLADHMPAFLTKSGAAGHRRRTGALAVGAPPQVESDIVEGVLIVVATAAAMLTLFARAEHSDATWRFAVVAATLIAITGIYAWIRRGRLRRAWLENARRTTRRR